MTRWVGYGEEVGGEEEEEEEEVSRQGPGCWER